MRGRSVHAWGARFLVPDLLIQVYVAHIHGERVKKSRNVDDFYEQRNTRPSLE